MGRHRERNERLKFSIIGPNSFPTTKEIFPLVKEGRMWLGQGFAGGNAYFRVPEDNRGGWADGVYDPETGLVKFRNVTWFTNLEYGQRHAPMQLMTQADNLRYNKQLVKKGGYRRYDNFDAIDVPLSIAIPSDYDGVMGVPVSYLDNHCPEQFDIVGITKTWFGAVTQDLPVADPDQPHRTSLDRREAQRRWRESNDQNLWIPGGRTFPDDDLRNPRNLIKTSVGALAGRHARAHGSGQQQRRLQRGQHRDRCGQVVARRDRP